MRQLKILAFAAFIGLFLHADATHFAIHTDKRVIVAVPGFSTEGLNANTSDWSDLAERAKKFANNIGWIQFCAADGNEDEIAADLKGNCVAIRPISIHQLTVDGKIVTKQDVKRQILALYAGVHVEDPTEIMLSRCTEANREGLDMCGENDNGGSLRVKHMPISVDLSNSGFVSGILRVDAMLFLDNGHFTFGGRTTRVHDGTAKFDLRLDNFEFSDNGHFIVVRFMVKTRNKDETNIVVSTNTSGFTSINGGEVIVLPRYAIQVEQDGKIEWRNCDVERVEIEHLPVVQFKFEGPFRTATLDPLIRSDASWTSEQEQPGEDDDNLFASAALVSTRFVVAAAAAAFGVAAVFTF